MKKNIYLYSYKIINKIKEHYEQNKIILNSLIVHTWSGRSNVVDFTTFLFLYCSFVCLEYL